MGGYPYADRLRTTGEIGGQSLPGRKNESQGARPVLVDQRLIGLRDAPDKRFEQHNIVDQQQNRFVLRSFLDLKQSRQSLLIVRIDCQSITGLGRESYQSTPCEDVDSQLDRVAMLAATWLISGFAGPSLQPLSPCPA